MNMFKKCWHNHILENFANKWNEIDLDILTWKVVTDVLNEKKQINKKKISIACFYFVCFHFKMKALTVGLGEIYFSFQMVCLLLWATMV